MKDDVYVGALFSDNYLEHHGILGMKWGVRRYQNEDGSLTDAGKRRYSKGLYKTLKNKSSEVYRDKKFMSAMENGKPAKAFKELEKASKEYDEFVSNGRLRDKYARIAGKVSYRLYAHGNPGMTEKDWIDAYLYDDADQGSYNSFQCYLIDKKGINPSEYHRNISSKIDAFHNSAKDAAAELLGKYSNARATKGVDWSASDVAATKARDYFESISDSEPYMAYNESYLSPEHAKYLSQVKQYIEEAKRG